MTSAVPRPGRSHAGVLRSRPADDARLVCTEVGRALLLHRPGPVDPYAQRLAGGVAADPEHTVVVLDLAPGASPAAWSATARLLGPRPGGFRLVFTGNGPAGATTRAAQWLADRLGRTVITHDGAVVPVGDAGLFVPAATGSGWVRFRPGAAPQPESHRFPRPAWDPLPVNTTAPAGSSVVEPLPGGVWVRRVHPDPGHARHRNALVTALVVQHEVLTVVLGCPGAPPLSLADMATVWGDLPPATRAAARFVEFGPVACAPGTSTGQALADLLGEPVTFYTGLPSLSAPDIVGADGPLPRAVLPDGRPGWHPYAGQLRFSPGAAGAPPRLVAHRRPVPDVPEIAPGRYAVAPDTVLEVVTAGLWVRPPEDPADADAVRSAPLRADRLSVVYEAGSPEVARRMHRVAVDTVGKLEPSARRHSRILAVGQERATVPAAPSPGPAAAPGADSTAAPSAGTAASGTDAAAPVIGAATASGRAPRPSPRPAPGPAARPDGLRLETAEPDLAASGPATAPPTVAAVAAASGPVPPGGPAVASAPPRPAPVYPIVTPASPARRAGEEAAAPVPAVEPAATPVAPDPAPGLQPIPNPIQALQPTPGPAACVCPPAEGIARERAWLRRSFAAEYDADAGAVSALLSRVPGLRAGADAADVLVDLVALRLYLRRDDEALADVIRAARPGPHVPLGRCAAAGLSRLPSYRGATQVVVPGAAGLADLYRRHPVVTEWAFLAARRGGRPSRPGDLEVRIWSSSARRTPLLDDRVPDRVVFAPGTAFRVLAVRDGAAPVVLLRELPAGEDTGAPDRSPFDDIAEAGLDRAAEQWPAPGSAPADAVPGPAGAPGVLVPAAAPIERSEGER
ncbi:hypothetical protein [Pseudonocardia acidicola]|uniref:ADP-ribosyltransferase exoenzyme n=1 Tax=Pseudonocardia acidicola TaxID=2724939 RepID=A0ABX1SFX5_9PSEU|nr:hypothetical protein [Pseudonocardia acidicola]NMH99697.1 hypothetical protein [Pseudonocardia acidicola]